uniref:Transmembrane protein n=1 Tax=Pseudomonas fluorescens (strain SBW25) TaxID=216595 RepID=A0A0G4E538_PSEFS|nr:hypothetical protein [Pseudomonas fluorescens]CEK42118.1 hypothetical protein PQBR57_0165 [Pseudomonas fluorescens SBW25]
MSVHIDVAGYIVMFAALWFATIFGLAVIFVLKYGSKSKVGQAWSARVGIACQILGMALACSSTTMPLPPLLIFMIFGIALFCVGRFVKQEARKTNVK